MPPATSALVCQIGCQLGDDSAIASCVAAAGTALRPPEPAAAGGPGPESPGQRDARERREVGDGGVIKGYGADYQVAFTFDDGPKHDTTPLILDALDRYDIPATFFVVGWRIGRKGPVYDQNRAVLADIARRGYHIGNHTYHHHNLAELDHKGVRAEIDDNAGLLTGMLGYTPYAFRPPFGATSRIVRAHLRARGFTEVRWSIDTEDFRSDLIRGLRRRTVASIIDRRGGIVLMHDTKAATADQVAGILDDLEAENCRRLAADEPVIMPVSLHYFMRDQDGADRPVPPAVVARTKRYRDNLPHRCEARNLARGAIDKPIEAN